MPEIGETLRETRMRRRIDMTEVEAATKIRAKYLRALENEEWDLLPGPTFVKTFLRTYAEYLDLDPRLLVEEYRQRYERPSTQDLTPFGPGAAAQRRRRRRGAAPSGPLLVVVLGVVVLLGALYLLGIVWGDTRRRDAGRRATTPTPTAHGDPDADEDADEEAAARRRRRRASRCGSTATASASTSASWTRAARRSSTAQPRSRASDQDVPLQALPGEPRQRRRADARRRQDATRWPTPASRSATRCGRARSRAKLSESARGRPVPRERPRGHRRHRHRGPLGDHPRPQRPVAVRAAARARRRARAHRASSATARTTCAPRSTSSPAMDLIITSGGLGPTADDLTAEVVAEFAGAPMVLDPALEERIWARRDAAARALARVDEEAMRAGARKQAFVPEGATVLEPVGTAPGLLVPASAARWSSCCPGRRASCRRCGRRRSTTSPLRELLASRGARSSSGSCASSGCPSRRSRRRCASSTPTRCRWRSRPACGAASSRSRRCSTPATRRRTTRSRRRCARATATSLFSRRRGDDRRGRRAAAAPAATIATAESCTGGLMAGRLTDLAGSSAYVLGGLVVYSNEAKTALAGVPAALIEAPRRRLARGGAGARRRARARASAPTSASASPASPARAAGRRRSRSAPSACRVVHAPRDAEERTVRLPGGRADVRDRTTTVALHMLRALLLRMTGEASPCGLASPGATLERLARHGAALSASALRLFVALDLPATSATRSPRRRRRRPGLARRRAGGAARHARVPRRAPARRRRRDRARPAAEAEHAAPRLALGGVAAAAAAPRARARPSRSTTRRARSPRCRRASPTALDAAGVYTPEKRPFRPHVTVARAAPARAPAAHRRTRASIRSTFTRDRGHALRARSLHPERRPLRAARQRDVGRTDRYALRRHGHCHGPEGRSPRAARLPRCSPSRTPPRPRCSWGSCVDFRGVRCATLTVPLDRTGVDPGHGPAAPRRASARPPARR